VARGARSPCRGLGAPRIAADDASSSALRRSHWRRGDADEGTDLAAFEAPQLGQLAIRVAAATADAGHALQQLGHLGVVLLDVRAISPSTSSSWRAIASSRASMLGA